MSIHKLKVVLNMADIITPPMLIATVLIGMLIGCNLPI